MVADLVFLRDPCPSVPVTPVGPPYPLVGLLLPAAPVGPEASQGPVSTPAAPVGQCLVKRPQLEAGPGGTLADIRDMAGIFTQIPANFLPKHLLAASELRHIREATCTILRSAKPEDFSQPPSLASQQ